MKIRVTRHFPAVTPFYVFAERTVLVFFSYFATLCNCIKFCKGSTWNSRNLMRHFFVFKWTYYHQIVFKMYFWNFKECNIHPFGQVICMSISQRFLTSNFCSDVLISIPLHVFCAGTGIEKGSPSLRFSDGESCRNSLFLLSLS